MPMLGEGDFDTALDQTARLVPEAGAIRHRRQRAIFDVMVPAEGLALADEGAGERHLPGHPFDMNTGEIAHARHAREIRPPRGLAQIGIEGRPLQP
ncbi:MAG: hypothetical protein PW790_08030 [Parvibaculaceae bacterium]|nr:hypothetical protein [Parvibaculaceae bacterium]